MLVASHFHLGEVFNSTSISVEMHKSRIFNCSISTLAYLYVMKSISLLVAVDRTVKFLGFNERLVCRIRYDDELIDRIHHSQGTSKLAIPGNKLI